MSVLKNAYLTAQALAARVVFPELDDPRVAKAAQILAERGLCQPLPLAEPSEAQVAALMNTRGCKEAFARRLIGKPLYRAAAMVAVGEADVLVAGPMRPPVR